MRARPEQHDAATSACRQRACAQGWKQPGLEQRRLSATRRSDDPCEAVTCQARDELVDDALAAEEVRAVACPKRGEPLERANGGAVERGVLAEDRPLEALQRAARLEPELVVQEPACRAIDLERLCLPAGAVQREHELPP